jgi:hypothetical protein
MNMEGTADGLGKQQLYKGVIITFYSARNLRLAAD